MPPKSRIAKPKRKTKHKKIRTLDDEIEKYITKECNNMIWNEVKDLAKEQGIKLPKGSRAEVLEHMGHKS